MLGKPLVRFCEGLGNNRTERSGRPQPTRLRGQDLPSANQENPKQSEHHENGAVRFRDHEGARADTGVIGTVNPVAVF